MASPLDLSAHAGDGGETIPEGLPRPGDVVAGKLRIDRVIGRGGMGIVYAAHHQALDKRVALKFVLPDLANRSEAVRRFMKEARAGAKVRGDHVGQVLDVAELPTGTPYIVMEYLEGEDLGALLARTGPLPISRAIDFVLQACEALAQAHTAQIVHRDIKPSNLFLCSGGSLIKVLDFGISKLDDPASMAAHNNRLTASTTIIGSPSYMAPEQLRASREVDPRADIWSLGVVLFELLSGDLPFSAGSLIDLGVAVMTQPAPSVRLKHPEIPQALDDAIQRCLAKDVVGRFRDVGELAMAIAPFGPRNARAMAQAIAASCAGAPFHGDATAGRLVEDDDTILVTPPQPMAAVTVSTGPHIPTLMAAVGGGGGGTPAAPLKKKSSPAIAIALSVGIVGVLLVFGGIALARKYAAPKSAAAGGAASSSSTAADTAVPAPPVLTDPSTTSVDTASPPPPAASPSQQAPSSSTAKPSGRPVRAKPSSAPTAPPSSTPPAQPPPTPTPSGISLDRHG